MPKTAQNCIGIRFIDSCMYQMISGTISRDATLILFMVEKQTHALKTKTLGEECSLVRSIDDCNIERILHGKQFSLIFFTIQILDKTRFCNAKVLRNEDIFSKVLLGI